MLNGFCQLLLYFNHHFSFLLPCSRFLSALSLRLCVYNPLILPCWSSCVEKGLSPGCRRRRGWADPRRGCSGPPHSHSHSVSVAFPLALYALQLTSVPGLFRRSWCHFRNLVLKTPVQLNLPVEMRKSHCCDLGMSARQRRGTLQDIFEPTGNHVSCWHQYTLTSSVETVNYSISLLIIGKHFDQRFTT